MAFQLSPGVNVSEIDLTTIVPSVGTSEVAHVGNFQWGPVDKIETISDEEELVRRFHKPDSNTAIDFLVAASVLAYGNNLKVIRPTDTAVSRNATDGAVQLVIKNEDQYIDTYKDLPNSNTFGMFAAKYPGELGNSLKVSLFAGSTANTMTWNANTWAYYDQFDGPPSTSTTVARVNGRNDEMHIIVLDGQGKFTGVANTVLEKFSYVSKAGDARNEDGSSNYYVDVLEQRSKYIYAMNHALAANGMSDTATWGLSGVGRTFAQNADSYTRQLSGGIWGPAQDDAKVSAFNKFANAERVDISLVVSSDHSTTIKQHIIDNVVEKRKDCVAFISPKLTDVVNNEGDEVDDIITTLEEIDRSTSYAVMDSNWKYTFDKYNNVYRWIPVNGDIAGLCVRTDYERAPWYSPAGFNRGRLKNVKKLAWNPDKTDRDELYKRGVNPVLSFPGEGPVLYGDKTMLAKPSAFDRINVRRLFIVLEKAIARAAKYSLFEFNDTFTRSQFVAMVEPYLRDVQGRRGIFDYKVVCDTTNNTPEIIDRNEFVGDIYIKPARSINFIQLNFVAVRTGVSFEEIVGQF